jgi:hypothetical protein
MTMKLVMRYGPRLSRPPDGRRYVRKVDQAFALSSALSLARSVRHVRGGAVWIAAVGAPAHRQATGKAR